MLARLLAVLLVAGCVQSDDPAEGGFYSGISGLAGGGYEGRITLDPEEPNGQPRRSVDASRARELFGFEAHPTLRESRTRMCAAERKLSINLLHS